MLRSAPRPKYLALFALQLQQSIAYPLGVVADLFAALLSTAAVYYLWRAVFVVRPQIASMNWPAMQSYVLIANAIFALLATTSQPSMMQSIRNGAIASELLRPYSYLQAQLVLAIGRALTQGALASLAVVGVGIGLAGIAAPPSLAHGIVFLLSVAFSFLISFLLQLLLATLCFWTHDSEGLRWAYAVVSFVFSGGMVPLPLLPDWLRTVALLLPFQAMIHTPLLVYLGMADLLTIARALVVQAVWAAALGVFARLLWLHARYAAEIQGG